MRSFVSDNNSGICPEAIRAMQDANEGFEPAYGEDRWTEQASDRIRFFFEKDCEVFFVFNGTAANSLSLASLCQSYHSVICTEVAHVETDECGGPEFFSNGTKLLLAEHKEGKLSVDSARHLIEKRNDFHYPKPKVVSLTQCTELGTVYSPGELNKIRELSAEFQLKLHMDGARFANALASLNCSPAEISWKAGVDVLTLGGTKNGMAVGEAVVFFDRELAEDFEWRCKQAGQLASKMRFISAPWIQMIDSGAYLENARHANRMAKKLSCGLLQYNGIELISPTEANEVFVALPLQVLNALRDEGWFFYTFIGVGGARFVCSWSTTEERVQALLQSVGRHMGH